MFVARRDSKAGVGVWLGAVAVLLTHCNLVLGINEPKDGDGSAVRPAPTPMRDSSLPPYGDWDASGSGDGGVNSHAFAEWPMPNPPSTNLPNPQSYDVSRGPDIVFDNVTKLEWQRTVGAARHTWIEAIAYCQQLATGGGRWRLPSRIELLSIVDFTMADPAIDKRAFPNTPSEQFWTGSPFAGDPASAWTVHFGFGAVFASASSNTSTLPARCVRNSDPK